MLKPLHIGLIGFGTVGSATYQLLKRNQHQIQRRLGRALHIRMVADLDTEKSQSRGGRRLRRCFRCQPDHFEC